MKFNIEQNEMTGEVLFSGSFSKAELASLNLCGWDRKIIDGASSAPSDALLALELIYRRAAEQAEAEKAGDL